MPSVVATIKVKADKVEEARSFLRELSEEVRKNEPGTQAYVFHQSVDDPTVFVAYEKYANAEAVKAHRANLANHGARFGAILDGAPDIVRLEEV